MKKLVLLLLISCPVWAQQSSSNKDPYEEFSLLVKVEDQEKYYKELIRKIPLTESNKLVYNPYHAQLAVEWLAKGDIEKYRYYKSIAPSFSPLQLLDITNVLESWVDENTNIAKVDLISRGLLDDLEKGSLEDGIGRTQILLEVCAMANCKLGHVDEALKYIEKSSQVKGGMRDEIYFRNTKSNYFSRYAKILSESGLHQKALDMLSEAVRNAESNASMIATLKEVYIKVYGNDKGCNEYIDSLKEVAYHKVYKEVEKTWHADPKLAPDMSLSNLKGEMVRLSDYIGKILVVDFWTTMCKPCVAAFTAFQRAVDYNKNGPFQLFVIDMFEEKKTVQSFVDKKGIKLDVLLDPDTAYAGAIGMKASPHKFVIDPKGYVRFDGIGYAGSDDKEFYKLKAMIEITKERSFRESPPQSKI